MLSLFYIYALFTLVLTLVTGASVNVTVDDTNPDPDTGITFVYAPDNGWAQGNGCGGCSSKLDASETFESTWHDSTWTSTTTDPSQEPVFPTATFQFEGVSIATSC